MTTPSVSRGTFIRDLSGVAIDPQSEPLKKALAAQGVDPAQLTALAGKDGKISGGTELNALFNFVDGFDKNGSGNSFAARDASAAPTKSAAVHDALASEVASLRAVANASPSAAQLSSTLGVGTSKHPVIDTRTASPALSAALGKAGIAQADFQAAAGADGRFTSAADYNRLHALLDRADGATDGKATGKTRDATTGALSDTAVGGLQTALASEATQNAALPENARPGTKSAPPQPALTVAADAATVATADQKPVRVNVPYINQFSLHPGDPEKGGKACFEAATQQTNQSLAASKIPAKMSSEPIQVAYAEDARGRTATDPAQAAAARAYVDTQLDKGRPVLAGVSYADNAYNPDQMTDHFITISGRGYDADGKVFYSYKDPGAGGAYAEGKLYVDQATGKMFKEGDKKGGYVQNADYEVTQVRTYTD